MNGYCSNSGYAEINPQLRYNKSFAQSDSIYEKSPSFDKYQEQIGKNQYANSGNDYYDGGNSSLALRSAGMKNTPVSIMFFSPENIARIQKKIKSSIYSLSEGKFRLDVDQNEQDLIIVMRAVFLQHAKNLDKHIVRQVKALNQLLLNEMIPDIMTNIKQYYGYLKEINEPLKPIARPLNVSGAGRKMLPSITTVWGF